MPTVDLTDDEFKAVQVALEPFINGVRGDRSTVKKLVAGELDAVEAYFLPGELGRTYREEGASPA